MFSALKGLSNLIFGKENDSILQIPTGQLYYKNPTDFKSPRTLIFPDCCATLVRTHDPYQFLLVISSLEDENVSDENQETEKSFLLDSLLKWKTSSTDEKLPCFTWFDLGNDSRICTWEFVMDPLTTSSSSMDQFEKRVYQCMFQRKYSKTEEEISPLDLTSFIESYKSMYSAVLEKESMELCTPQKKQPMESLSGTPMSTGPTVPSTPTHLPSKTYLASSLDGESLVQIAAELYLYDMRFHQFVRQASSCTASILKLRTPYTYCLVLYVDEEPFLSQIIESRMTPTFNREHRSFVWNWFDETSHQGPFSWSIKFLASSLEEIEFKRLFSQAIYETLQQEDFNKVQTKDQEWLTSAYDEDVDMDDAFDSSHDLEEEEEEEDKENHINHSPCDDSDEEETLNPFKDTEKNSNLTVGYKYDRSYVMRGNKMGVFNHAKEDLKFETMISSIKTMDGKEFTPSQVMLHEQDSAMLMMDPKNDKTIYKMDLNRGSVVEEWQVDEDIPVEKILPESKYAQLTPQKTLVGMNKNTIFRIDPRRGGIKRVASESKQYASKVDFTCAATTGKGELAVASKKGDIRLYNKLNLQAKTHLPGLGDPILGMDTTENGKWILATCKTYLLILNTELKDKGSNGFQSRMGDKKPKPCRLQLRPEHLAWMDHHIQFTVAKFSTGKDEEKAIITSTGPYVITWNFRSVKSGKLYDYSIKKYTQNVVADNFKFGQDQSIIVALPSDVQMVKKSHLTTPTKMLKSKSRIVNSPY